MPIEKVSYGRPHHPLHDVLRKGLADFHRENGELIIAKLARSLGCGRTNVTMGIVNKGSISPNVARKLISLSNGKLSGDDLINFIN